MIRRRLIILLGILTLPSASFADSFFVRDAVGISTQPTDIQTVTELVKTAVLDQGHNQVASDQKDARYVLQPKIIKLGHSYVMSLEKDRAGHEVFAAELKASSPDDWDAVVARLVRSVIREIPVDRDASTKDVVTSEADQEKRATSLRRWYIGIGPFGATSNLKPNDGILFGYALAYGWELRDAFLDIQLDGAGSNMVNFGFGGHYYLSDYESTPIIGASVEYGSAQTSPDLNGNTQTATGFVLGLKAGYQFFRTSDVNLEVSAHYSVLMSAINGYGPQIYGLQVGLYF